MLQKLRRSYGLVDGAVQRPLAMAFSDKTNPKSEAREVIGGLWNESTSRAPCIRGGFVIDMNLAATDPANWLVDI